MKYKFLFLILCFGILSPNLFFAQALPSNTFVVENPPLTPTPKPCDVMGVARNPDPLLLNMPLSATSSSRDLILELLNYKTCETRVVSITVHKDGEWIDMPQGLEIWIDQRNNGITFNGFNTSFTVTEPKDTVVIANTYPIIKKWKTIAKYVTNKKGKRVRSGYTKVPAEMERFIYSPYSTTLNREYGNVLAPAGNTYLEELVAKARAHLREYNVFSLAIPGTLVSDVAVLSADSFKRRVYVEHMDYDEFVISPDYSYARVAVIIGVNSSKSYSMTASPASARGLMQFTKGTWNDMRKAYPTAGLSKDFMVGSSDHLQSMVAAMLLDDYNLKKFREKYGLRIMDDPRLEEYLAGAYNGGPGRMFKSLSASISAGLNDWYGKTRNETKGYIEKIRYLKQQPMPKATP